MRKLTHLLRLALLLFILSYSLLTSFAQLPQALNYQAVARDASGHLIDNQLVGVRISIISGSATGIAVYTETHSVTTNPFGLFTLAIGTGTTITGVFDTIAWNTGLYWLKVELDPIGGTTYTDMGTSQLLTVPYAMYASDAGKIGIAGTPGQTLRHDGTNWVANDLLFNNGSQVLVNTTSSFSPFSKLQVLDNIAINRTTNPTLNFYINGSYKGFIETKASEMNIWAYDAIPLHLGTSSQRRLTIAGNGNVGIGTSNPPGNNQLSVVTNHLYAGYFVTDSASVASRAIHAECTVTGNYDNVAVYGKSNSANNYGYGGYFVSKYRAVVGAGSNTSTDPIIGVYGNSYSSGGGASYGIFGVASSNGGTSYGVYCSGSGAYTGTWTLASDKKFKRDVVDISDEALANVLKLRPVSYLMNTDEYPEMNFAAGKQMGFIAQEVEEVFPTLVEKGVHPGATKTDPMIEYKGLNYIGLIPVLTKAIQEQNELIKKLEKRITELEKK